MQAYAQGVRSLDPVLRDPPQPEPPRRYRVVGLLAALTLGVGLAWWALWTLTGSGEDRAHPTGPVSSTSVDRFTPAEVLVSVAYDADYLKYPRLLPAGFDHCVVADTAGGVDRFCDADADERWVQVVFDTSALARIDATGGSAPQQGGATWTEFGRQLVIPVGQSAMVVTASGLSPETVTAIVDSIPLIGAQAESDASVGPIIDFAALTDDELAALLAFGERVPRVDWRWEGAFGVSTSTETLTVGVALEPLWAAAWSIPRAQVVDFGHPVVLGESRDTDQWSAIWVHRGHFYQAGGRGDAQAATEIVASIVDAIEQLASNA